MLQNMFDFDGYLACAATDPSTSAVTFQSIPEVPAMRAERRIKAVLLTGHPAVVAFSSGKDSSVLAMLVLSVARDIVAKGLECPPIVVVHSNTLVEQPEIVALAEAELEKMRGYAGEHGIPLLTRIGTPMLSDSFPVRVIGGRALPAFPDSRSDCSTDWKIKVNRKLTDGALATLDAMKFWKQPVVMTGVRQEESIVRDQRIAKRGEIADGLWTNDHGDLRLSPILDFTTDDVWELIGLAHCGEVDSYSDFADTMRIYRDAGGSSCVVVADMKSQGHSKPCGTRTGCWACTRVGEDKSMQQMIASDAQRYGHLKPLARLRDFISRTQYDWSRRNFVGRSIDADGNIAIGADVYSPDMLRELLLYTLSAQELSGVPIISVQQLIAIDARWSQYAIAPPFSALKIYFDVMGGKVVEAPNVDRFPKTEVPKIGKLHVGAPSFNQAMRGSVSGLRNVSMEMFHESCGHELKVLRDGTLVIDVEVDDTFEVDADGAQDFLYFEAERYIKDYCREDCSDWTWGYKTYLQYGTIVLAKGRSNQAHEILQRSQWRQENELHGQRERKDLESRCTELFSAQLELL